MALETDQSKLVHPEAPFAVLGGDGHDEGARCRDRCPLMSPLRAADGRDRLGKPRGPVGEGLAGRRVGGRRSGARPSSRRASVWLPGSWTDDGALERWPRTGRSASGPAFGRPEAGGQVVARSGRIEAVVVAAQVVVAGGHVVEGRRVGGRNLVEGGVGEADRCGRCSAEEASARAVKATPTAVPRGWCRPSPPVPAHVLEVGEGAGQGRHVGRPRGSRRRRWPRTGFPRSRPRSDAGDRRLDSGRWAWPTGSRCRHRPLPSSRSGRRSRPSRPAVCPARRPLTSPRPR